MVNHTSRSALSALTIALLLAACSGQSPEKSIAAAKASLAKGDDKAAIIELKSALQADPSLAEARFLLGSALVAGGNMRDALIELGKAKDLGYPATKVVPKTAEAMLGLGQFEKLLEAYAKTQLESPEDMADLQVSLAGAYAALGKHAEARARIDAALAAQPGNIRAQLTRVRALASSEGVVAALKAIDETLAKAPKSTEAWQLKGDLLSYAAKYDDAVAAFRQAVQLDGTNYQSHSGVLNLLLLTKDLSGAEKELEALKKLRPNAPTTRRFTAALALEKGDLKTAIENIQEVLKVAPDDVNVLHLAGAIEFRRGNLLQAEAHLSKAMATAGFIPGVRLLLARTYARGGDEAKALQTLQPLLGERPNLDALSVAAEIALQQGDAKRASAYLSQALERNPGDKRSQTAMAAAQIGRGNLDQGTTELRRISSENPDFTLPDMLLINTYMQQGRFDAALGAVDALEKKTGNHTVAANLRGVIELRLGHKDNARKAFEAALKSDPAHLPAIANLTALDVADGRIDAAVKRYKTLVGLKPNNLPAHMALIALQEKQGVAASERAQQLRDLIKRLPQEPEPRVALARLELDRKDVKAALGAAQDAVAALPGRPEVWAALGQVQQAAGDFNQAIAAYSKVATLMPGSGEPYLRLAELYAAKKDKTGALQQIRKALGVKSDYLPAQLALVSADLDARNYTEARSVARTVQQQRPHDAIGHMLEGDVESSQKNWAAAAASYQAGLAKNSTAELAIKLHRTLISAGKSAEAKKVQDDWLAKNPTDTAMPYYLGNAALSLKNYELAEKYYRAVVKLRPDHAMALNNIAWLMNETGKPEALEYAEKANTLAPNQPAIMDTLSEIYAKRGQLDKALEIQKRAVSLATHTPDQRLRLARLYLSSGNKAAAREELLKLRELGFQFSQQGEVTKLLADL